MPHQSAFNSVGLWFSMLMLIQILARNVIEFRDTSCRRKKMKYEMPWMTRHQTKQGQNKKCCTLETWISHSHHIALWFFIAPRNPQYKPIWSSCPMGHFTHFPFNWCWTSCWLQWCFWDIHAPAINIHFPDCLSIEPWCQTNQTLSAQNLSRNRRAFTTVLVSVRTRTLQILKRCVQGN